MINAFVVAPVDCAVEYQQTINLRALAEVGQSEHVDVICAENDTLALFDKTLRIVEERGSATPTIETTPAFEARFVPEIGDLRQRFLFAETVGGYATLQDLLDKHSPEQRLLQTYTENTAPKRLSDKQTAKLENYRDQIKTALAHASAHLMMNSSTAYSPDELQELNAILTEARERFEAVDAIVGSQLIFRVEDGVRRLFEFQTQMRSVQRSIDGIFMVEHEVMFMPTNELTNIVNSLFKAIGNPYVAEHVDGILLLAARNLLIQAVSFYSYYGKQQIYTAFKRNKAAVNQRMIAHHVRSEIHKLFRACMTDNKLVLKRLVGSAEREFEISIDTIRDAAERTAVEAVSHLIPNTPQSAPPPRKSLIDRISGWLFR